MNATDTPKAAPIATTGEGTIAARVAAGLGLRPSPLDDRHFSRLAVVYVRQSDPQQVLNHIESRERQYALVNLAVALGWPRDRILLIDDDQGNSGKTADWRTGFHRLLAEVTMDHVGLILGIEMSRVARNNKDWHHLMEMCAIFGTILADEDRFYDPRDAATFEPMTLRASSNPLLPIPGLSQTGLSSATTRLAPRRSHSKEKKPSHAPISRTERPCRLCGRWILASFVSESSRPGVVIPFPRSILCHQLILLISSIEAAVGAAIGILPEIRRATGPDRARGVLESGPRVNSKVTGEREQTEAKPETADGSGLHHPVGLSRDSWREARPSPGFWPGLGA